MPVPTSQLDPFRALRLDPRKTLEVCAQIAQQWPADGALPPPPVDDAAEIVRVRKLIGAAKPGEAIFRRDALLAAQMATFPTEAPDWREHAVDVLAALPRPLGFEAGYVLYQHHYGHGALRNAVAGQYVLLAAKPFSPQDAQSVFHSSPVDSLVVAAFRGGLSVPALVRHFHLGPTRPLAVMAAAACYRVATDKALGTLERPWLVRHTLAEAVAALETYFVTNRDRGRFVAAMVRAHGALEWRFTQVAEHAVLDGLFARITQADMLGRPNDRPAEWTFDPEVAQLVRRWLNDAEIQSFFNAVDAEPARKEFWRRANSVIDEIDWYRPCNAFAMKIGPIWFMEFGVTGNACYPYEIENYQRLRRHYNSLSLWNKENPGELRRPEMIFRPSRATYRRRGYEYNVNDGRLIHNPRWYPGVPGWHRRFEAYIETFCKVTLE